MTRGNQVFASLLLSVFFVHRTSAQLLNLRLRQSSTCGRLQTIRNEVTTLAPWTAGIFVKTEASLKLYTSGIIIGPTTVLSVAGGPFGYPLRASKTTQYTVPSAGNFLIIAGLKSTSLDDADEFSQIAQVHVVEPCRSHAADNEQYHYLIYHLKTPFNFSTPYVKDICLPLFLQSANQSPFGLKVVQTGFAFNGIPENRYQLKVWPVQTSSKEVCESVYFYHYKRKLESSRGFCAHKDSSLSSHWASGYLNNVEAGADDDRLCQIHGSAMTFNVPNIWYLGSVLTAIPGRSKGRCSKKSFYIFGDILRQLPWMLRSYTCSPNKFSCDDSTCIPWTSVCNGVKNCQGGEDEDKKFCMAMSRCYASSVRNGTKYSCGITSRCIAVTQVCDGRNDCDNGSDEEVTICQSGSTVPYSESARRRKRNCVASIDMPWTVKKCFDPETNNEAVDCDEATFPGAKVSYQCMKYATSHYAYDNLTMECDPSGSGEWLGRRTFSCDPDCGTWNKDLEEQYPGFPWFVAIGTYIQGMQRNICAGTLVESKFILTSAKCIAPYLNGSITNFKVTTLPRSSNYKFNVYNRNETNYYFGKNIFLSDRRLSKNDEAMGLAIFQLTEDVDGNVDANVDIKAMPVCYGVPPFRIPAVGKIGSVAGFTLKTGGAKGTVSTRTGVVVPNTECTKAGVRIQGQSQFCVVFHDGHGPCDEDVGGGIYLLEQVGDKMKYVLRGVADPSASCERSTHVAFTDINHYSDWILDVLELHS